MGFTGGLWLLWQNTPEFRLEISHSDRFIHCLIKDGINNFDMVRDFLLFFPHHHLQKHLWNQISDIPNTGFKPWIMLGNLMNYLPN